MTREEQLDRWADMLEDVQSHAQKIPDDDWVTLDEVIREIRNAWLDELRKTA